jgi:hypothetical protein
MVLISNIRNTENKNSVLARVQIENVNPAALATYQVPRLMQTVEAPVSSVPSKEESGHD